MKKNSLNKFKYSKILLLLLTSTLLLFTSCDTTNPPSNRKITLEAEDASCTEAWLNLKIENIYPPQKTEILLNDSLVLTANIYSNDTTLYLENLLPNRTYSIYSTIPLSQNSSAIKSNSVSITTMDTTSHNFTWETFTFGGGGNSHLSDVAIINDNNIWAVGEIHTEDTDKFDSNGVWVQPYNAVHWNGSEWELKRILVDFRGNTIFLSLESVFAFSATDIWLVSSLPIHGDGENWEIFDVREMTNSDLSLTNVWGTSSEDIYFVGRSGSIAHYNGSKWRKIDSGTELNIYDIYGDYNEKTNKHEIIAVASHLMHSRDREIIKIENKKAISLSSYPMSWDMSSVWFIPNKKYYVVGTGVYKKNLLEDAIWNDDLYNLTKYYTTEILGTEFNNIFILGACGVVLHFNGVTWRETQPISCNISYGGISIKNNIVVISGSNGREGILLLGKR